MVQALSMKRPSPIARTLAASLIAVALAGCGIDRHEDASCDPADPPTCADQTTLVTCDADGTPHTQRCAAACLAMADTAGHGTAACVASGTVACQTATFVPGCIGGAAFATCTVVAPLEGAGHTTATACTSETTCRESALAVACVDPRSEVCDPETFVETCDGSAILGCNEHGFTTTLATCAPPKMCKVSGGDARCVRPDQEPCDTSFVETCADSVTVSFCSVGFTDVYGCSGVCRESATSAACFSAETPTCTPGTFQQRCEGQKRIYCDSFGLENETTCKDTMRCEVVGDSAHCVDLDAVPCDAATHLATCDGNARVFCDSMSGFTRRLDCGERLCHAAGPSAQAYCVDAAGSACDAATFEARCDGGTAVNCDGFTGWSSHLACTADTACYVASYVVDTGPTTFAFCGQPGSVPCDFTTYQSRCDGAVASLCSLFTNYTMTTTCPETETCHSDRFCLGPTCGQTAFCLADDSTPCDGTAEYWCEGATIMNCFDGVAVNGGTCPEGKTCTALGDHADCK